MKENSSRSGPQFVLYHNRCHAHMRSIRRLHKTRRLPSTAERYRFTLRKSSIHGRGVFTLDDLPARRKIGEIVGERLPLRVARRRVQHRRKIYLVELDERSALDCSRGNHLGHVNHSCEPNCFVRIICGRVEMYTLKAIPANTEVTIDYGATPHKHGMKCACGSKRCKRKL